jgi:hypothetical protein
VREYFSVLEDTLVGWTLEPLVSEDPIAAKRDGIEFLPWSTFLRRLWDGEIV